MNLLFYRLFSLHLDDVSSEKERESIDAMESKCTNNDQRSMNISKKKTAIKDGKYFNIYDTICAKIRYYSIFFF